MKRSKVTDYAALNVSYIISAIVTLFYQNLNTNLWESKQFFISQSFRFNYNLIKRLSVITSDDTIIWLDLVF